MLNQLLGSAMQQTDMRIDAPDNLTVEFQHKPKHAVGRRMLRAEIDGEIAKAGFWHGELTVAALTAPPGSNLTGCLSPGPERENLAQLADGAHTL
jgi:hypothetical protein